MSIIDFVFEKGNSFHPTDVLNRGVGGNELTIISWAEELVKLGNKVNLFVKGGSNYFYNGVNWYEYNAWN
ncbi:MAG: glycosyltransferase family 4 protein, partial [Exilispira sp.]|nr:glycosyltransferase family 4 protein [Exilispira sp.]